MPISEAVQTRPVKKEVKEGGPLRILILEDVPTDAELVVRELTGSGLNFEYRRVDGREAFEEALTSFSPDLVLADYALPQFTALEALGIVKRTGLDLPLILVTGSQTEEVAVQCMKEGADDYILKSSLIRLPSAIRNSLKKRQAERENRRLEEKSRHSQKLEAIGQLAGGIAHDFNNTLMAITGYCELLLLGMQQDDPLRWDVEGIQKATAGAATLTRQLLAFSSKQMLQPRLLDLNSTVESMKKMLRRVIGAHIDLEVHLEPALNLVKADAGQMEQVIMNLAVNARDAMIGGGLLLIETRNQFLDQQAVRSQHPGLQPGHHVVLEVIDNGRGMDRETLSHVFEPFFTTKTREHGTGLGLSTVYGIVRQSGGQITMESEPDRGTIVRIYLPRATPVEASSTEEMDRTLPIDTAGTETILLADDNESVRETMSRLLRTSGYKVLQAGDGVEALEVSETYPGKIDLLITDVIMPRMGGKELGRKVTEHRPATRVLYISGYAEETMLSQGMLDPGTSMLQKPTSAETLLRRVRELLG